MSGFFGVNKTMEGSAVDLFIISAQEIKTEQNERIDQALRYQVLDNMNQCYSLLGVRQ
jgi:U3 small nucleolar RNA-associated protein 14